MRGMPSAGPAGRLGTSCHSRARSTLLFPLIKLLFSLSPLNPSSSYLIPTVIKNPLNCTLTQYEAGRGRGQGGAEWHRQGFVIFMCSGTKTTASCFESGYADGRPSVKAGVWGRSKGRAAWLIAKRCAFPVTAPFLVAFWASGLPPTLCPPRLGACRPQSSTTWARPQAPIGHPVFRLEGCAHLPSR